MKAKAAAEAKEEARTKAKEEARTEATLPATLDLSEITDVIIATLREKGPSQGKWQISDLIKKVKVDFKSHLMSSSNRHIVFKAASKVARLSTVGSTAGVYRYMSLKPEHA